MNIWHAAASRKEEAAFIILAAICAVFGYLASHDSKCGEISIDHGHTITVSLADA
jgi:hypothetical protein